MTKKKKYSEENFVAVEETLSKTELFIEKYQKVITISLSIIVLLVFAYFAFNKFYLTPKNNEAQSQIFMAEKYLDNNSIDLALNGDGNYLGFIDIIKEYKMTKSANLAKYYAGLCYYKKGEFENAIDYLKSYKPKEYLLASMAKGVIGDAYVEIKEYDKALSSYLDAIDYTDNSLTTPQILIKAGAISEILGKYDKATEIYQRIKVDFSTSPEAADIDKYIARVKALSK